MGKWQGLISGGGVLLVLAGAVLAFGAGRASSQNGAAVISINPPSTQTSPTGSQFNVNVDIANVHNLGAFELTLKYNPDVLDFLGASDAGFLTTTGRSEQCMPAENAADAGVVRFGCNTLGLVENGAGQAGPDGDGTLGIFTFTPKALGNSDLTLVGLDEAYVYTTNGETQHGQTSLDAVEVCRSGCNSAPIDFSAQTGVVAVIDPAVATPTALAPTPTPEPRASRTPNRDATVRAALGTPERRLGDTTGSSDSGSGTSGTTTLPGPDGVLGTADDVQSAGVAPGPDGVLGTSDDVPAGGVRGLPNASGSGSSGSVSGATRGPNGAPIAGYGRADTTNPWPGRAGATMIVLGALALLGGITVRGGKQREM